MRASFGLGIAAVAALVCGACNGFPDPQPGATAQAESPEEFLTYQDAPATEPLTVGNQVFVFQAAPVTDIPVTIFTRTAQGTAMALPWDRQPFSRLYAEGPDRRLHPYHLLY